MKKKFLCNLLFAIFWAISSWIWFDSAALYKGVDEFQYRGFRDVACLLVIFSAIALAKAIMQVKYWVDWVNYCKGGWRNV